MKVIALAILSALASFAVPAQQKANDSKLTVYHYKCYMQLEDGREVVRDYRDRTINRNGNLERMLLQESVAFNQGLRLRIRKVNECVELETDFSTAKARELDRETFR